MKWYVYHDYKDNWTLTFPPHLEKILVLAVKSHDWDEDWIKETPPILRSRWYIPSLSSSPSLSPPPSSSVLHPSDSSPFLILRTIPFTESATVLPSSLLLLTVSAELQEWYVNSHLSSHNIASGIDWKVSCGTCVQPPSYNMQTLNVLSVRFSRISCFFNVFSSSFVFSLSA